MGQSGSSGRRGRGRPPPPPPPRRPSRVAVRVDDQQFVLQLPAAEATVGWVLSQTLREFAALHGYGCGCVGLRQDGRALPLGDDVLRCADPRRALEAFRPCHLLGLADGDLAGLVLPWADQTSLARLQVCCARLRRACGRDALWRALLERLDAAPDAAEGSDGSEAARWAAKRRREGLSARDALATRGKERAASLFPQYFGLVGRCSSPVFSDAPLETEKVLVLAVGGPEWPGAGEARYALMRHLARQAPLADARVQRLDLRGDDALQVLVCGDERVSFYSWDVAQEPASAALPRLFFSNVRGIVLLLGPGPSLAGVDAFRDRYLSVGLRPRGVPAEALRGAADVSVLVLVPPGAGRAALPAVRAALDDGGTRRWLVQPCALPEAPSPGLLGGLNWLVHAMAS